MINLLTFQLTRLSMITVPARVALSGKFLHFPVTMTPAELRIFLSHRIAEIFHCVVNFLRPCLRIETPVIEIIPGCSCTFGHFFKSLNCYLFSRFVTKKAKLIGYLVPQSCAFAVFRVCSIPSSHFLPSTEHQDNHFAPLWEEQVEYRLKTLLSLQLRSIFWEDLHFLGIFLDFAATNAVF